jgi:hypothetical protein
MGKEAHISNLFKEIHQLLDRQQLQLNAIAGEKLIIERKLERLQQLINEDGKK